MIVTPPPSKKREKVCIIGFAPSYSDAPWGRSDEYEYWTLNEFYRCMPNIKNCSIDRWFEIHDRDSESKVNPEYQAFLKSCPVPLYMWRHFDDLPNSLPFPKDEIMNWLEDKGFLGSGYFTNSISWMLAFAMMEGFKHVELWGIDMSNLEEYGWQKPSVEYFVGLAEGMGIKIHIPSTSELLKCAQLYGFESNNRNRAWIKKQRGEMDKGIEGLSQQMLMVRENERRMEIKQAELRGAREAYQTILRRMQ